ncbi:MAG: transcriptional repressor LexA [Eubacteriales bacterium]|nr:transcriptional repressor LexA [Eubacteriales bacterium]
MRTKNESYFERLEQYIDGYREANGASPSIREIEAALGISRSTVSRYLSFMREKGTIDYEGPRRINTREAQITRNETVKVPLLGTVACGIPKFAEENIEEYVRLPIALFGQGSFFLLRADGDSMIDANIESGDLVLIRQQSSADPGQIVVALIDNEEATLKRYYPEPENRRVRLHPENESMADIFVPDCVIQGVAVKVLKDLA